MKQEHQNHLENESSPYLRQHARQSVNWHTWGEKALAQARLENKIIIVSIGYSACHWCHVMSHESFDDPQIARIMNEHYVSIKVDREERPDVDHYYMDSLQAMGMQGGWPLNIFALPDGRAFYGGTYFRKDDWARICMHIAEVYKHDKGKWIDRAEKTASGLILEQFISPKGEHADFDENLLSEGAGYLLSLMDTSEGGLKGKMKFPMPSMLGFMLYYAALTNDEDIENLLLLSLNKMASGGIYDHVGGGFFRYSTDPEWHIPHFEKMLYDNAQLISLYANAYRYTKDENYKKIVEESIAFAERELRSEEGAFYSALDADSEGEEGKYYVWTKEEIYENCGDDADIFCSYYGLENKYLWEHGRFVLFVAGKEDTAKKFGISIDELEQRILRAKNKLLEKRMKRTAPALDNKILTSWNALMIMGLIDAWKMKHEEHYLNLANDCMAYLLNYHRKEGNLYRCGGEDKKSINAFADDYAFIIMALLSLYENTFDNNYLDKAVELSHEFFDLHYDKLTKFFRYSPLRQKELPFNKMEYMDTVIPSSNAVMSAMMYRLSLLANKMEWMEISELMTGRMAERFSHYPHVHAFWGINMLMHKYPFNEISFSGVGAKEEARKLDDRYIPNSIIYESKYPLQTDSLSIQLCRNKSCYPPFKSVEALFSFIGQ